MTYTYLRLRQQKIIEVSLLGSELQINEMDNKANKIINFVS